MHQSSSLVKNSVNYIEKPLSKLNFNNQMNKKVNFLALFFLLLGFTSCEKIMFLEGEPKGGFVDKTFDEKDFNKIDIKNAFFVTVKYAPQYKVSVKGAQDDIDDLKIEVKNNRLSVEYDQRFNLKKIRRYKMEIAIETPDLKAIDCASASNTEISGFETLDGLDAEISGASSLRIDAKIKTLAAGISGASDLKLKKDVETIDAQLSGASTLDGFPAFSKYVYLELSGASKAEVYATETLNVDASGASKVTYKGSPKITEDLSGGSKILKD